ncbi:MAG: DUF3035 domain-containing protein [Proteobacteria bacterium]|nr:DUF3035 domain-containing protein [Pseudomonadota bacterium]
MKSQLGIQKNAPDEFSIVSKPNLHIPQTFDLPAPGMMVEHNSAKPRAMELTPGEVELMQMVRGNEAGSYKSIRALIDSEYNSVKNKNKSKGVVRRTVAKLNDKNALSIIDPEKEAERLEENKRLNKRINEGKIPTKNADKATLDRIFGTEIFS